jgi:hypothetical protein
MTSLRQYYGDFAASAGHAFIFDSSQRLNCHSNFLPKIALAWADVFSSGNRDAMIGRQGPDRSQQ